MRYAEDTNPEQAWDPEPLKPLPPVTGNGHGVVRVRDDVDFNVHEIQHLTLRGPDALLERDAMSPYVWQEPDGRFGIMMRAVPRPGSQPGDTGQIWAGWSDDGQVFDMLDRPSLVAGPDEADIGGVEDPTVMRMADGSYVVYYTGVAADRQHGQMFYATGPSVDKLTKAGIALASTKTMGNTKEATVMRTEDGQWRLFYEYAVDDTSRIGLAIGPGIDGPWKELQTPLQPRERGWDNWHLSTGPILMDDPDHPIMFYNGATRDARWRIGWVMLSADCLTVIDRSLLPLVTPPPVADRADTDIAFAASVVVQDGHIWLYYSLQDSRLLRARIRRS